MDYEDLSGQEEAVTQSPRPSGRIKLSDRKQLVQKKRTRVKFPKLCREECPNYEGLNIFFNGVTVIECHNCQQTIVKGSCSIVLNTQECEVEQDVELFFKELNIY